MSIISIISKGVHNLCAEIHNLQNDYSMIFKTFDNDIDKWTAKIGIFGKSFNELGTAVDNAFKSVIDNLDNFDENVGFWDSLKDDLFSKKDDDKDWIKNSLGKIISKENIDSYIEELDLDTAKEKLQGIFDWQEDVKNGDATWSEYFETLKDGTEKYIPDLIKNTDDLSKLTGNDLVNACDEARDAIIAHNRELENMSFTAKASKIAFQALATVGNMIAMWAISKGIELAVKGIDKLIHSAEYAEKAFKDATDSAKSFSDAIKDIQKDTVNMESSVNSIIDRYAELSQGVNPFTNENKSLPTEKYEEFLDLNKQLAGLFPSLTRNYDKNGIAILGLSGSVDSVTESIRALVEQEKELGQAKIRENIEGYFNGTNDADGAWKALEGRKKSVEEINEELNSLTDTYNTLINSDEKIKIGSTFKNWARSEGKKYIDYIKNTFGIDISDAIDIEYGKGLFGDIADVFVDFSKLELDETQKEQITKSYDTFYSELLAKQKTAISEFESQNTDISNNALFWLEDLDFYKDSNIYVQTAMQNLVRSIDWSHYDPEQLDYDGVKRILQDSILTPFQVACDDPIVKEALEDSLGGLFALNLSDMSINDIDSQLSSYIQTIAEIFHENPTELKVRLGFEEINDEISDIQYRLSNRILNLLDDKYVLKGHSGEPFMISVDGGKSDDYTSWLKATKDLTVEQAELFLETIDGAESVSQALEMWNTKLYDIKKADNQPLSLSETIDQLNTKIKPAFDSLESAWNNIFTEEGFALNSINILSTCDSIKSKLDELNRLDGITVDYSSYEDFVRVLRNSESTEKEVQDAFDALATSITQVGLLGKEDFETMKAALEDLGVVNNEIVAFDALISNTWALKEAGLDLANATEEDITDFANKMMVSAENAAQAIKMLIFQKELCNLQEMNSVREVSHLRTLAKNAGYTGEAIQYLTELTLIYSRVARGYYGTEGQLLDDALVHANELKQLITESSFQVDFDVEKESAYSAGKDAGKSFTDALDKELTVLDKKMEAGYIDFNDYIQARLTLIEAYYKQGKLSADEYYSYLEKHYDTQLSYMDKVVSAVTRRIDTEIDALKQQKEDVESLYKVQIESLEKQKSLLEEANQERQRQIDLQKALYDLERARNQRTKLVYSEDKGMHYVADDQSIRDARKNADDAKYNNQIAEIAKSISKLEEARDQETSAIDAMISNLEEYKDAWSDITSAYKEEQEDLLAAQFWGADWESKVLNNRLDVLKDFKEQYIRIQREIAAAAARESANEQVGAAKEDEKGSSGSTYEPKIDDKKDNPPSSKISSSGSFGSNFHTNRKINFLQNIQAYGSGTNNAKKGLNLVGEDGAEAYFDNHGHVAIVTKPTLIPMEGGEVVKNERDTRELLDPDNLAPADTIALADIDGKEARYTIKVDVEAETFTLSDGTVLAPLQPEGRMFELQQKFDAYMESIAHNVDMLSADIAREHSRQMQEITNPITNSNTVNNRNVQPVVSQNITLNCPNVTNNSGIEYVRKELGHLSLRAMQESMK